MTDLHRKKASEIFGVPEDKVTEDQRRFGKIQNYVELYSVTGRILENPRKPQVQQIPLATAEVARLHSIATRRKP